MNYRHAYHAGGPADVFKHIVLVLILQALRAKAKPFCVLDTHAGIGRYDLTGGEAARTGEFRNGIGRLLQAPEMPAILMPYLDIVRASNISSSALAAYPGSPAIAQAMLRDHDRLVLVELHEDDFETLRRRFRSDRRVSVHHRDGYEALKALLPPAERRGLVLIDPAFEATDEFARMIDGLTQAYRQWPTGVYALWYPIKHRAPVDRFLSDLSATSVRKILLTEMILYDDAPPDRLNGSGLVIVNLPWGVEPALREALSFVQRVLSNGGGSVTIGWLAGE